MPDTPKTEGTLVSHLVELRDRLMRALGAVLLVFICFAPFANDLYELLAKPLMSVLPEGNSMISTEPHGPFFVPFKFALACAFAVAVPYLLYQMWAFVAPGLYAHEKRLVIPLLLSSSILFYLGIAFAYFVVFPIIFAFFAGTAPEGVAVMTDINAYLGFVIKLFFAFGLAFEVPVATVLMIRMGITSVAKLKTKRPYIIIGAFVMGMLLTPPDIFSQTLLAVPVWLLFEAGLFFSRYVAKPAAAADADGDADGDADSADADATSAHAADENALKSRASKLKTNLTAMYYPKLDSIRCFAVLAVMIAHIFQIWTWDRSTFDLFPLGNAGVVVFFVLSGFLITKLLLDEPVGQPLGVSFKNFYARRTLRIFPIYYLYLLIVFSLDLGSFKIEWSDPSAPPGGPLLTIRDTGIWPWLYLTNIWIYKNASWITFNSPLWSLSVEEQFYLVWPFIVLFLRDKMRLLAGVFVAICALSICVRLSLFLILGYTNTTPHIEVFTFTNLDFLATGGLLALAYNCWGERMGRYGLWILGAGLLLYYVTVQFTDGPTALAAVYWSLGKYGVALAGAGWILYSLHSNPRYTPLHNPVTIYLGKISYGMYLYHNAFVFHYREITGFFGFDPTFGIAYDPATNMLSDWTLPWHVKIVPLLVCLLMVIAVASVSYYAIERPLLKLKDRFRTKPGPATAPV